MRVYASAVMRHWWMLVPGGLLGLVATISLFIEFDAKRVPWWAWVIAMLAVFSVAQFLAWRDVNGRATALSERIAAMEVRQDAINEVARLRQRAIVDFYANVPTPQTLPQWVHDLDRWRREGIETLEKHFAYAVVEWFEDLGAVPAIDLRHALPPTVDPAGTHLHQLRMLAKELSVLEEIIQKNTRLMRTAE